MTFFIPRPNLIESDEGFSVEVLGRAGLRYTEGERVLILDSEVLAGPSGIILFSNNIWVESRSKRKIDNIDQKDIERIIENVRAAFKFQGFEIQIV